MSEHFQPFNQCLRQPLWPASDGSTETIPTGSPEQGCPLGTRDAASGKWTPVRKLQTQHSYQVVQNIHGQRMPYAEEWGSLDVGDPNRLGMYRLMIPDPSGTGSFADAGDVQGWNGSVLVSIYPAWSGENGVELSAQTVPSHLMGPVPQWDADTVDRSVGVDSEGNVICTPDTFEGFHWLRRGYAIMYALPPRGYQVLYTEFSEKTIVTAVHKLDEIYPFLAVPANRGKHERRYRFLTGSSAGGPPVLAVMQSASQSDLFDGAYSSGPVSSTLTYFGGTDALWVRQALEALRPTLGHDRATVKACAALLGFRAHAHGPGDELLVPDPDPNKGLLAAVNALTPWHGSGGDPYGNVGVEFGSQLLGRYAKAFEGRHSFQPADIAAINAKITELMGGQRQASDPRQFLRLAKHHLDTGRVWKPFVFVYGLSDGPHTPLFGRVLFDMAKLAEKNDRVPAGFYTDHLISLNTLEQTNRGGEDHWSHTGLVGLMNLTVDLLEAKVMGKQPMAEYLASNYGAHPDARNRYFFEPGMTRDIDQHIEDDTTSDAAGSSRTGNFRHHLVPFALTGGGQTRYLSGTRFENGLQYEEDLLAYRGQTHDGRSVEWLDNLLPREMAGRPLDDLYGT